MIFSSIEFIFFFLPVMLIAYYSASRISYRWALNSLVIGSCFFYAWWNLSYLVLIVASILLNFAFAFIVSNHSVRQRRLLLGVGVVLNVLVLIYFKYTNFLVDSFNSAVDSNYVIERIVLPLAVSFFTFQQIAYLVDSYREKKCETSLTKYSLFVLFFPQLIAGPIVHHKELLPQFSDGAAYNFNSINFSNGILIFLIGLSKKLVLADGIANYATPVFDAANNGVAISFFEAWVGTLAYTFQLYFDFSGYSDMAIGLALMFNIVLPLNFNAPYKALSITEFWRRWHMTLSKFLRDYIYIPLGGNRNGSARRYTNLFLTMVIGGIWHGAGWTFLVWGALHGFYLIINHAWSAAKGIIHFRFLPSQLVVGVYWLLTFLSVSIAWVVFRAESFPAAQTIYAGMLGLNGVVLPTQILEFLPFLSDLISSQSNMPLLGGGTIIGFVEMSFFIVLCFSLLLFPASHLMSNRLKLLSVVVGFYFIIQKLFYSREASEFIYFQF